MSHIDVTVVVPVFNEKESLAELVATTVRALKTQTVEFIFIDDGSTDGSFAELTKLKKSVGGAFTIIRFRKNLGKSAALAVGFAHAAGDAVVTLDADLQDDPAEIPNLLKKLSEGYGLVVGWRKDRQDPKKKILSSKIFNGVVNRLGGLTLHDINCGLKVYTNAAAKEIPMYGELHRFVPLLVASRGFAVTEVPVVHHERRHGVSKFAGKNRAYHAFFDLATTIFLTTFARQPLQVFGPAGVASALMGLVILVYLSAEHFMGRAIIGRPLLFLGILFVLFGVQIFSTGLLGELLLSLHARKEQYPIEETVS